LIISSPAPHYATSLPARLHVNEFGSQKLHLGSQNVYAIGDLGASVILFEGEEMESKEVKATCMIIHEVSYTSYGGGGFWNRQREAQ